MLWFCAGTAGELIKLYPLVRLAERQGRPWRFVVTGQSGVNFWNQWDDFRLPREKTLTLLETDQDLKTSRQALRWFCSMFFRSRSKMLRLWTLAGLPIPQSADIWIVHGDTLSSLIGALTAKKLGVPIAHVEAGLRSPSLLNPFPEEITRRLVSRMAQYHFAQDEHAYRNLQKRKGVKINTEGNTLFDAMRAIIDDGVVGSAVPSGKFAVANLHRFENLNSQKRWAIHCKTLLDAGRMLPVYLVMHPQTQARIDSEPGLRERLQAGGVVLLPRLPFSQFIQILDRAEFVLSDGGSNQEECSYLGKPCLLLRDETERFEGLSNGPCVLSRFDTQCISEFLSDPEKFRRKPASLPISPSEVILRSLGCD